MKRSFYFGAAPWALCLALATACDSTICTATVQAADNDAATAVAAALELLPDDTLAGIVVPQLSLLDAKISALGGPLQNPIPSPLMMGKGMLGIREGLKEDGPAMLALVGSVNAKGDFGTGVVIVPVTDYQKLISSWSPQNEGDGVSLLTISGKQSVLAAQKNGFGVFVGSSDDERKLLQQILDRTGGTADSIAPLKSWLGQQDLAFFLTGSGVKVLIQRAQNRLQANQAVPAPAGETPERTMLNLLDQLVVLIDKEVAHAAVGLHIDDDHTLHIVSRVRLTAAGDLAKAAAGVTPPTAPPLTGLPQGSYLAAFDGALGGSLRDWLAKFSLAAMKATLAAQPDVKVSDDDWKKLADLVNQNMQGAQSMSFVMGVPAAGGSMYSKSCGLVHVADAAAFLKNYETSMTAYSALVKSINNPLLPEYELSTSEIDGQPTVELTTDMSKTLAAQQQNAAPRAIAFSKMLLGGDGKLTMRLAAADKTTVVMAWGEPENLTAALEAAKSPDISLASDMGVKTTAALLPKNAQWRGFISPAGYIDFTKGLMQMAAPQLPFRLPDFPNTPAVGFAAQISPENLDLELVVPAAVLEGAGNFTQQLRTAAGR